MTSTYLIEEHLGLTQNVPQFGELQIVAFQCLGILIDFAQFIFQLLECRLLDFYDSIKKNVSKNRIEIEHVNCQSNKSIMPLRVRV